MMRRWRAPALLYHSPVLSIRDGSLFIVGARPLQTLSFLASSSSIILLLLSIRIFGLLSFF
ncbi:uncharacterized protein EURHEDRAFT_222014 [Aspergillus ruber CBS 135680]|uniref:Uncharacterized protein n=1 Tax=Aspergillus ruber (strain CBS 135680) TaxID=1388766 RepID=A0A017SR27_ASPRC|nr:uncharacterized protein EURHEDRAFT_222014 [Aspergillus ruber CBS 135680]EYE98730.1 hypothetical protein EURHEDRAFT_222014 [Aspergillus ruber CBS 135680]